MLPVFMVLSNIYYKNGNAGFAHLWVVVASPIIWFEKTGFRVTGLKSP